MGLTFNIVCLLVVVDQKLRLENSLASERMINEQSRLEHQQKTKDEKEQRSKDTMEANMRYAALQQHFNLMKSQMNDLTEECSASSKKQLEEINSQRLKVSELQGKVSLHQKESATNVELLKVCRSRIMRDIIRKHGVLINCLQIYFSHNLVN